MYTANVTENLKDVINASIIGKKDDRKPLSKSIVSLSNDEKEQAMRCTGHIFCPNAEGEYSQQFSAELYARPMDGHRDNVLPIGLRP